MADGRGGSGVRFPRTVLLVVLACVGLSMRPAAGVAPPPAICDEVRAFQAAFAVFPGVAQVLDAVLLRIGCTQSPTTVDGDTTTTFIFVDCPGPGGIVVPCPTIVPPTTFPPTSIPGGTLPSLPVTTLPQ